MGTANVALPPGSFLQATVAGTKYWKDKDLNK